MLKKMEYQLSKNYINLKRKVCKYIFALAQLIILVPSAYVFYQTTTFDSPDNSKVIITFPIFVFLAETFFILIYLQTCRNYEKLKLEIINNKVIISPNILPHIYAYLLIRIPYEIRSNLNQLVIEKSNIRKITIKTGIGSIRYIDIVVGNYQMEKPSKFKFTQKLLNFVKNRPFDHSFNVAKVNTYFNTYAYAIRLEGYNEMNNLAQELQSIVSPSIIKIK